MGRGVGQEHVEMEGGGERTEREKGIRQRAIVITIYDVYVQVCMPQCVHM